MPFTRMIIWFVLLFCSDLSDAVLHRFSGTGQYPVLQSDNLVQSVKYAIDADADEIVPRKGLKAGIDFDEVNDEDDEEADS